MLRVLLSGGGRSRLYLDLVERLRERREAFLLSRKSLAKEDEGGVNVFFLEKVGIEFSQTKASEKA